MWSSIERTASLKSRKEKWVVEKGIWESCAGWEQQGRENGGINGTGVLYEAVETVWLNYQKDRDILGRVNWDEESGIAYEGDDGFSS